LKTLLHAEKFNSYKNSFVVRGKSSETKHLHISHTFFIHFKRLYYVSGQDIFSCKSGKNI